MYLKCTNSLLVFVNVKLNNYFQIEVPRKMLARILHESCFWSTLFGVLVLTWLDGAAL